MLIEFDKSFSKSLDKISDSLVLAKIENVITELENTNVLSKVRNIKKLSGFRDYYRIKLGDYRLGIELIDPHTIRFIIVAHRKDIYRNFPKR